MTPQMLVNDPAALLLIPAFLGVLVALAAGLRLAERLSPRFRRFLDDRFGPE